MHERRFNPDHMSRLDNPERRKKLPPEKLLELLPIGKTDNILDLGAGTGYFAIPAAKMTDGSVFALDIEPKMLDELQARLAQQHIQNVKLITGAIEEVPVEDEVVDHVIASFVMHEVDPLSKGINEIHRVLKPGGHCFCLEWEKIPSDSGPPLAHRIHSNDMVQAFQDAGFTVITQKAPTEANYVLVVKKHQGL